MKKISLIIGILIILLLAAGVFLLWQGGKDGTSVEPTPIEPVEPTRPIEPIEPAPDTTQIPEGWKTYRNQYYHYQISVPNDWVIEEIDYNNDPIVRLSSPNKEIIISSRFDDHSIDDGSGYSDSISIKDAQVGDYLVSRKYQPHISSSGKAYSILVYSSETPHPANIELPSFRIAIKGDLEKNDILVLQILKTFKNTGTLKTIEDLIEYSIPKGWDKKNGYITSPDYIEYEEGLSGAIEKGMRISLSHSFSLLGHTLEAEKNSWKETAGTSDFEDTIIDGHPAFKYYENYEGHFLSYYVIKDGYGFSITFASPNLVEEKKYQEQINAFIFSVHLK